jgi:hypothetical protein
MSSTKWVVVVGDYIAGTINYKYYLSSKVSKNKILITLSDIVKAIKNILKLFKKIASKYVVFGNLSLQKKKIKICAIDDDCRS